MPRWFALLIVGLVLCAFHASVADEPEEIDFNRHIRPLLSDRCFACHGPDANHREAGLRFDKQEAALAELETGATAIVPGDLDASEMWHRITADDPDLRMPPEETGKSLDEGEIALLKRWIEEGADWQPHWSFIPPKKADPPELKDAGGVRNEIDRFIRKPLEAEGLSPSPPADKATLLRRVTFDLTGLPPTLEELEAFLGDDSPDAYEKVVDRLLKSPRYGEHMARYWLDAARYGDTHGLHLDNYREMWPYRDWVVRAFNENKPFNQFVTEQLAGDLLENPTLDQLVATGFNRCHVTTNEGGSIKEEVYVRNVVDRVTTTGTVFMGLTFECTRCHDHKYDPLTQQDFYSMFAFFNSLDGAAMDGNKAQHPPVANVPSPEAQKRAAELEKQIASVRDRQRAPMPEVDKAQAAWEASLLESAKSEPTWHVLTPKSLKAVHGSTLTQQDDLSVLASGKNPPKEVYEVVAELPVDGVTAIRLEGLTHPSLTDGGHGRSTNSNIVLTEFEAEIATADEPEKFTPLKLTKAWADHEQADGSYFVAKAIDGNATSGWATAGYMKREDRLAVFATEAAFGKKGATIRIRQRYESQFASHQFGRFRLAVTTSPDVPDLKKSGVPDNVQAIVKIDSSKRTPEQAAAIRDHFRQHVAKDVALVKLRDEIKNLESELAKVSGDKGMATTLIWREQPQPRPAYILKRGEYDQRGDQVERATPSVLPPLPEGTPLNRLGLAQWLTSRDHPLLARVTVNRFWQQLFGAGLVKTAEDFGSQGTPPSHPDLLDWMAVQFIEDDWDVKQTMKRMVMSATYRQSSRVTPQLLERDPRNELLAHGPRFRLDAEMIRDQALAVSGLLVNKLGGPGVRPPQPDGLWFAVGYTGSNTVRFKADTGPEKVHRRTLYTFIKRTALAPQMGTFDASNRESCVVRRERTNTPLQMLLLMNDPQFVEAARVLAERTIREGGKTKGERAAYLFRICSMREPTETEAQNVIGLYEEALAEFEAEQDNAAKLVTVGSKPPDASMQAQELAAWTMAANLVLCLDEVITKN